ncbi:PREDICTED: inactive leucine-rich repeat receptor-like protein kinase CORYNE isoform X2 [Tarenaya hassleriana]|nr:PREDICTED: inactive leucine-rich repeat receptor-like protein kinase CORYNE isoform X2 [Tarenaya hassleriana]
MEQRRRRHNAISLLFLMFLLFSSKTSTCTSCRPRTVKHYLSTAPPSSPRPPDSRITPKIIIISISSGIVTGLVSSLAFALLVRYFVRYMKQTPILRGPVIFSPKISPKTLQTALVNDTQLLGSNPNGKYYKTVLDNGLVVAVKRLCPLENGSPEGSSSKSVKRRVQKELEILAGLRHRNLMSLRAYVRESDGFSLVYDYVSNGSLEDVMNRVRANELQLEWEIRLRIAVGIVKGLQYIHFSCVPQILHLNLKPTNVMLDAEFEPRLSDCGLAKIMPDSDRTQSIYSAPESFQNNRYTEKSDVFSFGMILAVLLTGRDPNDPFFGEVGNGGSLGKWLKHLQQAGEGREALDKRILVEETEEDEMLMAVRISIICLSDFPADRPSSDELVHMLTQLHSF